MLQDAELSRLLIQRTTSEAPHQTSAGFMFAGRLRDERIRCINLALQLSPLALQLRQHHAQRPGQAVIRIFEDAVQRSLGMSAPLAERAAPSGTFLRSVSFPPLESLVQLMSTAFLARRK